jgi:hypothetical protein
MMMMLTLKGHLASVSRYTLSQAVPHLVKLFLNPDELPNRAPITVLLAEIVAAARDSMRKSAADFQLNVPLMPFKDEVLGVFTVGLKAASSCQPALAGFKAMVTTSALLTDEELGFIVHNIGDILQGDPDDGGEARLVKFLDGKRDSLIAEQQQRYAGATFLHIDHKSSACRSADATPAVQLFT